MFDRLFYRITKYNLNTNTYLEKHTQYIGMYLFAKLCTLHLFLWGLEARIKTLYIKRLTVFFFILVTLQINY